MRKVIALIFVLCITVSLLTGCDFEQMSTELLPPATETADVATIPMPEGSFLQIHFIDVGQADAALVLCDNEAMLIDGGNRDDSCLMYAYLKAHGVDELQYVVCTHAHEDHCGGLAGALNYATANTVYCPVTEYDSDAFDNFAAQVKKQNRTITVPQCGEVFFLGSATCTIIGPVRSSDEPNNTSIVLRIDYGKTSFVFAGDAEWEEETDILDAGYSVKCDILKVAHHGSDTSTGYRWLREAMPEYAVISVGKDNNYGHPTDNTLSKLRDAGVQVFRTDMQGTIICTSNGTDIVVDVSKNAGVDTLGGAGRDVQSQCGILPSSEENGTQGVSEPQTYVLNLNSKKFHLETCPAVSEMSAKNREERIATREELLNEGFSVCGLCRP